MGVRVGGEQARLQIVKAILGENGPSTGWVEAVASGNATCGCSEPLPLEIGLPLGPGDQTSDNDQREEFRMAPAS